MRGLPRIGSGLPLLWDPTAYFARARAKHGDTFVTDAFARRIIGWRCGPRMSTQLVLDALEQAVWTREREGRSLESVVAHTDRGSQYTAIRYTERLAEGNIAASVGSVGSSYDNALAESINGLYKTELIKPRGPWRTLDAVEIATAEWVDWFNHRRLYEYCGDISPAEFEPWIDPDDARTLWRVTMLEPSTSAVAPSVLAPTYVGAM